MHTKLMLSTCRKLSLSKGKNQLNALGFSGDTAKELVLGTLGMSGYAHLKR